MKYTEIIKAVATNSLFDFIAKHYYEMTKCELKEICLELEYNRYKSITKDRPLSNSEFIEELEERWADVLEEERKQITYCDEYGFEYPEYGLWLQWKNATNKETETFVEWLLGATDMGGDLKLIE